MKKMKWSIKVATVAVCICTLAVSSCSKSDSVSDTEDEQLIRPVTDSSSAYVDTVFSFTPAPGQFVNTDYADINTVSKITENKTISLGAWGGQIVLGFDHTVINNEGNDLLILGNAAATSAEPGIVWVSYDANRNGLPDDTWYELKGSAYGAEGYERNYKVTYFNPGDGNTTSDIMWVDNHNDTGYVKLNVYHKQSYFPAWITASSYTLEGSKLPDTNIDMSNPTYIKSLPFEFGYVDNIATAAGGDSLDISNAIDADGNAIALKGIDFIKIQTGIMKDMGWLGELSTEVTSVADASLLK
ncbi:hypothetical protein SAMN05192529_102190 [Arachidicoccus rhizosphaerae]|jgi:hypothetical protein|uniref:Cell surface protein n=1 Tax=Arachidicoccus rhizosphaerae TaxID=551991 RepID=A0A1H3W7W0_9BACT|nr:hypothetical protein [Arachidicoccus rhizosphaerae]SDZ82931.1 hypothetical protein SAMN05192529_102190 [Arachidicoccus rhizosphaerae]